MGSGGVRTFRDPVRQPIQVGVDSFATGFDYGCDFPPARHGGLPRRRRRQHRESSLDLYLGPARLGISASIRRPGELDGADNTQRPQFGVLRGTKANDNPARILRSAIQVHTAGIGTLDFHKAAVFDQQ